MIGSLIELSPLLMVGGLIAGLLIGLTGLGGAVIVAPMLVLVFGVPPSTAVSSDLVSSAITKPVGAWVHARAKTIHWRLAWWLCAGSIPGVLIGSWIFSRILQTSGAQGAIKTLLGGVLVLALVALQIGRAHV